MTTYSVHASMAIRTCAACGFINDAYQAAPFATCPRCERIYDRADLAAKIKADRKETGKWTPRILADAEDLDVVPVAARRPEALKPEDASGEASAMAREIGRSPAKNVFMALVAGALGLFLLYEWRNSGSASTAGSSSSQTPAERHRSAATVRCKPRIQALARWDFEWTDGWTEPVFSHSRPEADGSITYTGDKLKLQNGFGAWRHVRYVCTYDPHLERVKDVRISE